MRKWYLTVEWLYAKTAINNEILKKYPNSYEDTEAIRNGNYLNKVEKYFEFFYDKTFAFMGRNSQILAFLP